MILHMNDKTGDLLAGLTITTMLIPVVWWLLCALTAAAVASSKNRDGINYFFAALFFLGPLALAVAMLVEPGEPREEESPGVPVTYSTEGPSGFRWFVRGLFGKWD
jgi:hypothetical protein